MTMTGTDPRAIIDRWIEAINSKDVASAAALRSDSFGSEYPQSGEIIRGSRNMRAILESYPVDDDTILRPGPLDRGRRRAHRDLQEPLPRRLDLVDRQLFRVRGGQDHEGTVYFAPEFEPPEWRARWVEARRQPESPI